MKQFNFPTVLLYGEGALSEGCKRIKNFKYRKPLLVTDKTLVQIGLVDTVVQQLKNFGVETVIFDETHPNPIEEDCIRGAKVYLDNSCDSVIAVGGGSPMDAAKGIMVLATHEGPLAKYDDAKGGDQYIINPLPPLVAIATTAGTGSEVGRSGVIIIKETNAKTIIFHPTMMPKLAILEPTLTTGLPPHITAATGIDAFTHCLEAYFASGFHPMADGIAIEGMKLVLDNLATAVKDGSNLEARSKMLLAASMGATAFQKGLGMIHSLAHPLSSECGLHHGLANALMLPMSVAYLEQKELSQDGRARIDAVHKLFQDRGLSKGTLAESCYAYFESLGIKFGLRHYNVKEEQLKTIAHKAMLDVCHQSNMLPMNEAGFLEVLQAGY